MKGFWRVLLVSVLSLIVVLPGTITAQDDAWTCDEGPNDIVAAAQASYDAAREVKDQARIDKLTETYWLAARGEALCTTDPDRFRDMWDLRKKVEAYLEGRQVFPLGMEPGRVELGEHGLYMICVGEGSPTVIFEHGLAGAYTDWKNIQPAVSTITRSCTYSRLGIIPSDAVPEGVIRTTQDQVDDLLLLLNAAGIEPPYLMVGHSLGGYNLLLFTDQNPTSVVGMVLVDAASTVFFTDLLERDPDFTQTTLNDPMITERFDWTASTSQVAPIRDVGDLPLVVLTATFGYAEEPVWQAGQADFVTFSTNSRQIVAELSGHYIMDTEPELVIDAILWVLDEVRAGKE